MDLHLLGDEIGLRHLPGLPEHEGSRWSPGSNRAGCRTPTQWDSAMPNDEFSAATTDRLYLPQDAEPDRPTVAAQHDDPGFDPEPDATTHPASSLHAGAANHRRRDRAGGRLPVALPAGTRHLVVVNPSGTPLDLTLPVLGNRRAQPLENCGAQVDDGCVAVDAFGYGVFVLDGEPHAAASWGHVAT